MNFKIIAFFLEVKSLHAQLSTVCILSWKHVIMFTKIHFGSFISFGGDVVVYTRILTYVRITISF